MSFEAFVSQRRKDLQRISRATRSDHAAPWEEEDGQRLLDTLISDGGDDPLSLLERMEAASGAEPEAGASQAGAWLLLFRHFGNNMRAVARYLLISRSWAYRCSAHVRMLLEHQPVLPQSAVANAPFPRPWRKSRFLREPEQLYLPLDDELPLEIGPA